MSRQGIQRIVPGYSVYLKWCQNLHEYPMTWRLIRTGEDPPTLGDRPPLRPCPEDPFAWWTLSCPFPKRSRSAAQCAAYTPGGDPVLGVFARWRFLARPATSGADASCFRLIPWLLRRSISEASSGYFWPGSRERDVVKLDLSTSGPCPDQCRASVIDAAPALIRTRANAHRDWRCRSLD